MLKKYCDIRFLCYNGAVSVNFLSILLCNVSRFILNVFNDLY